MHVETFYPQNPLLKTHVEYFYFLKSDAPEFNKTYYSFPNILQSFNIHKNAECEIKPNFTGIYENQKNKYLTIVQGRYQQPLLVNLKGRLDKMTIVFKPLGLNHFINEPFNEVVGNPSRIFTEWDSNEYFAFLDTFYKTGNNKKRVLLLETFLLKIYKPFEKENLLQKALNQLTDFENERSMEKIAQGINLNVRTFNRLFDKHFGISPVAFKKIARFRHSMKNKLFSERVKTLTAIGYESNFYDQSYFIKMYKNLTENNPSKFFNSIEKLADDQLIFEFINK
jgi:AraC-like DNA-binding protein